MSISTNIGVMKTAQEALTCKLSSDLCYGSIYQSLSGNPVVQRAFEGINLSDYYQNYANVVVKKQNPLLNRFYLLRQQSMHLLFLKLLRSIPKGEEIQIIIVGGGYDISYEFYQDTQHALHYYVIDFPEIIERRRMYHHHIPKDNNSSKIVDYLGGDLLFLSEITKQLEAHRLDYLKPTIVIIECVLSYLPFQNVEEIITYFANRFRSCSLLVFDPIVGKSSIVTDPFFNQADYVTQTTESFSRKDATLHSTFYSVKDIFLFYFSQRWKHVDCMTMYDILQYHEIIEIVEPLIISSLESFDEYSSLQLLLNNYQITVASTNTEWFRGYQSVRFTNTPSTLKQRYHMLNIRTKVATEKLQAIEAFKKNASRSSPNGIFRIREATKEDIFELSALYLEVFQKYSVISKSIQKYIKNSSKDFFHLEKEDNHFIKFWVCDQSTEIIGCIGLKMIQKRNETIMHYEVCNFCVKETYQRQGIGKLLLQELIHYCKQQRKQELLELTVINSLDAAREFYKSAGFQLISTNQIDQECILHYMTLNILNPID